MFKARPEIDDDLVMTEGPTDTAKTLQEGKGPAGLAVAGSGGSADSAELPNALSLIGEDMTITGTMTSKGEIQIEGQVQGDITCSAVTIGDSAMVQGGVLADQVHVCGRVNGAIYGTKVTLRSNSHIDGDIHHRVLSIEEGAQFEGISRHSEDPKTLVQAAREARQGTQGGTAQSSSSGEKSLPRKRPAA